MMSLLHDDDDDDDFADMALVLKIDRIGSDFSGSCRFI